MRQTFELAMVIIGCIIAALIGLLLYSSPVILAGYLVWHYWLS